MAPQIARPNSHPREPKRSRHERAGAWYSCEDEATGVRVSQCSRTLDEADSGWDDVNVAKKKKMGKSWLT